ncbi:MAG: c-type cytochrome [Alphaproteobacteria bacterium]
MDDLGFNKIAAAVLATALGFMGIKEISHSALHVSAPDTPAYRIAVPEGPTDAAPVDLPFPQDIWVASMDAERGAKVFKKCTSCHNAEDGGTNGTGPNLWNVVGSHSAKHDGFKYSSAMTNSGLTWDYETLDAFLTKPTKYLSGTAMNFVGLKKETDRAAVIEYLRQASGSPIAKPEAAVVEAAVTPEDGSLLDDALDTVQDGAETVLDTVTDAAETVIDTVAGENDDKKHDEDGH